VGLAKAADLDLHPVPWHQWRKEYDLALVVTPPDAWRARPVRESQFRRGPLGSLLERLTGQYTYRRAAVNPTGDLDAVLTLETHWRGARPHQLTVLIRPSRQAELAGPLGTQAEFLRGAEGRISFALGEGRIQRGTLPERLFALAVLLREGLYGFGLFSLGRGLTSPQNLRRFSEWTGAVLVGEGKARVVESHLVSKVYDVSMTAEADLESGAFKLHGDGDFHPGWQFDISLKNMVNIFARLFRLARGKRGHGFEFDVGGSIGGRKSVENFRFKD